ncbi:ornithine decarboxylase [Snodgrassella sp. CFCC 13594]|uniref:ornithine decarboxylase n=1 Tax=Snodgrassella sp. CFCC 13594 TaxID=1775559 RepID=UPI0008349056|nr:ornithine decarboxylase [Snodgrassella sp. CFCC 13594]
MKIAASAGTEFAFLSDYKVMPIDMTDFTNVCAVVATTADLAEVWTELDRLGFDIPIFAAVEYGETVPPQWLPELYAVIELAPEQKYYNGQLINAAASDYIDALDPPFFQALKEYTDYGNAAFDCPGHQGGQFFRKHPSGRRFYLYFGETLFRADSCNADVRLGDLLIHEGPAYQAQAHAAKVFNADKTYFVLNGTSAANKIAIGALVAPGDLVLFDRNNHKSVHQGALTLCGGIPVYLETTRNAYGFIGGIAAHCFDEADIRHEITKVAPERAQEARPFRLAVIQLGTYDGTIYNARQVVDRIGHLCDYILFDSAWVGYEQFIPMMRDCSPLLLDLKPEDPGILVTQSVHKQQAGFSQASQIHKKDVHISKQARYCNHKRFNNAFMMHVSTSPFYPLFASLDVNAKMHDGKAGKRMWRECVIAGIEARKMLLQTCRWIRPFVPPEVDGRAWQDYDTDDMVDDIRFFQFEQSALWHDFSAYQDKQYFIDPCKLLLTTPGIDVASGDYADFGIPAAILAHYLRERSVIPEKADLNSILFLLTPAENMAKFQHLVANIARFEEHIDTNTMVSDMLPSLVKAYPAYQHMHIRDLCQKMHDFYRKYALNKLQKQMFLRDAWPKAEYSPQSVHTAFIRNQVELVPLKDIAGRVAAEGALPYPPGVLCIVPGEVWGGAVLDYFLALEEGINTLPGFEPEIQGVYLEADARGRKQAFAYVLKKSFA